MQFEAKSCKSHCRGCGRHFASDAAFYRHRRGPVGDRRCADPADDAELESFTGDCRIDTPGNPYQGSVWRLTA